MRKLVKISMMIALCSLANLSLSLDLSTAKAQGLVGEKPNGYIAAIKSTAEVNAIVADINAKRKANYQKLAADNNLSLQQVEKLAGEKSLKKTQKGHYIFVGNNWVKK